MWIFRKSIFILLSQSSFTHDSWHLFCFYFSRKHVSVGINVLEIYLYLFPLYWIHSWLRWHLFLFLFVQETWFCRLECPSDPCTSFLLKIGFTHDSDQTCFYFCLSRKHDSVGLNVLQIYVHLSSSKLASLMTQIKPVFIFVCPGNMFVILVVLRHRHMRTLTNVFFLNLTIGDFMVTVICIPITLGNYVYMWVWELIYDL